MQVDVFSETPLRGNPLAVVPDGRGLSSEEMQAIAREMNLSETTFVLLPTDPQADVRVRFFTPSAELPFAGAACVGAAARLVDVITLENLSRAIAEELHGLEPDIIKKNQEKALEAFELMAEHAGVVKESGEVDAEAYVRPGWIEIPFEDARVSAPVIHGALTSVEVRTGLWRVLRPVIDYDHCKHCWWVCSTYCPDSAIKVTAEGASVCNDFR